MRAITLSRVIAALAILPFAGACADPFSPSPNDEASAVTVEPQMLTLWQDSQMQWDNRTVTAVSNIVKTQTETERNSLDNTR